MVQIQSEEEVVVENALGGVKVLEGVAVGVGRFRGPMENGEARAVAL